MTKYCTFPYILRSLYSYTRRIPVSYIWLCTQSHLNFLINEEFFFFTVQWTFRFDTAMRRIERSSSHKNFLNKVGFLCCSLPTCLRLRPRVSGCSTYQNGMRQGVDSPSPISGSPPRYLHGKKRSPAVPPRESLVSDIPRWGQECRKPFFTVYGRVKSGYLRGVRCAFYSQEWYFYFHGTVRVFNSRVL